MKILVLGAYCSCNLGDAVICDCVTTLLQRRFPQAQIAIRDMIDRDRTIPRNYPAESALERFRIRDRIIRTITKYSPLDLLAWREHKRVKQNRQHLEAVCAESCDLVVFAGGQMLMDRYALFLEYCVKRFSERGIPVLFHACGTGRNDSSYIRRTLRDVLSSDSVCYLSCRDDVDQVNRLYLKNGQRATGVSDSALFAAQVYGVRKEENSGIVGLGVIYPNAVDPRQVMTLWQGIICELEHRGQRWQFFSNGDPADLVFAQRVIDSIPQLQGREDLILTNDRYPQDLVSHISGYKGLIAYRLHSHIIAASLDIPSVALVWDDKLRFFFEKSGHPERCFSVNSDAKAVLEGLDRAMWEGYDRKLLNEQREESSQMLIDAILSVYPQWR